MFDDDQWSRDRHVAAASSFWSNRGSIGKGIVIGGQLSVVSAKQVIDLRIFSIHQKPRDKGRRVDRRALIGSLDGAVDLGFQVEPSWLTG